MTRANEAIRRGNLLASLLAGAWRESTPAFECSIEELERVMPLLVDTGAAALAWRRLRRSGLQSHPAAKQLQDTYRLYKLLAVVYERELVEVFALLRSQGIEPVVVKGWAVARSYGEPETRPCGDIDLCVHPSQQEEARSILKTRTNFSPDVDVHKGFERLDERGFDELMSRSELVEVEGGSLRVLKPEDHLRVLCYHFLREGGWRPLWLCDIAAAVEARPAGFDWDLCLGGKEPFADWTACVIGLAHQLLGAELHDTPVAARAARLPRWLARGTLREWELRSVHRRQYTPLLEAGSRPRSILKGLRYHWPSPVEATVTMGASFNALPRLPFQVGNCLSRAAHFFARLPRRLLNEP
jgi:hypothetical protein